VRLLQAHQLLLLAPLPTHRPMLPPNTTIFDDLTHSIPLSMTPALRRQVRACHAARVEGHEIDTRPCSVVVNVLMLMHLTFVQQQSSCRLGSFTVAAKMFQTEKTQLAVDKERRLA
jgi:hypothetical protein